MPPKMRTKPLHSWNNSHVNGFQTEFLCFFSIENVCAFTSLRSRHRVLQFKTETPFTNGNTQFGTVNIHSLWTDVLSFFGTFWIWVHFVTKQKTVSQTIHFAKPAKNPFNMHIMLIIFVAFVVQFMWRVWTIERTQKDTVLWTVIAVTRFAINKTEQNKTKIALKNWHKQKQWKEQVNRKRHMPIPWIVIVFPFCRKRTFTWALKGVLISWMNTSIFDAHQTHFKNLKTFRLKVLDWIR